MRLGLATFSGLFLLLIGIGCASYSLIDVYFPVEDGQWYSREIQTEIIICEASDLRDKKLRFYEVSENMESIHNGSLIQIDVEEEGTDFEDKYFYQVTSNAVFVLSGENDQEKECILQLPFTKGSAWETQLRSGNHEEMSYEIVSIDETIQTPAGRFDDCIQVVSSELVSDLVKYYRVIWFAPRVGIVKTELRFNGLDESENFSAISTYILSETSLMQ